ncbi:apoptosis-resistant E3 ubiquitin protein ligase 1-like protein [Leptotrombidium deliense]|uniref:HECT-type E3 ubiquitin transferase n=1 Tax=Leptotrombidium deliense TaxID=299467 RepID=A0A443SS10_9ACAR|nr:apoptosis-resistant E3 ubiquitin protein ligase 1-like protein [Leptotrombidium deliense]
METNSPLSTLMPYSIYALFSFFVVFYSINSQTQRYITDQKVSVEKWWTENGLDTTSFSTLMKKSGCVTLLQCIDELSVENSLKEAYESEASIDLILRTTKTYKEKLILDYWLKSSQISAKDMHSLKSVLKASSLLELWYVTYETRKESKVDTESALVWEKVIDTLPKSKDEVKHLTSEIWQSVLYEERKPWNFIQMFIVSLIVAVGVAIFSRFPGLVVHDPSAISKHGFIRYITGSFLSPQNCKVVFQWKDPQVVGNTMSFVVEFFQRNGRPFSLQSEEHHFIEIMNGTNKIICNTELIETVECSHKLKVQFNARRAGVYQIHVLVGTTGLSHVYGSPFTKTFLPSQPEPQKIAFIHHCSTIVCSEGVPYRLFVEPKDKYGNSCTVEDSFDPSDDYGVDITEISTARPVYNAFHWEVVPQTSKIILVLKLESEGVYKGCVYFRGTSINNGDFSVVVLNNSQTNIVESNLKKSRNINFEVKLISLNNERLSKPKKVFIYISPKQLTVKEYILKIIPKRVATFRLCPSTRFYFTSNEKSFEKIHGSLDNLLIIDDGCQPPVEILCEERNVIVATYTHFLLRNIGGSETFRDKQDFFYYEVRKFHHKNFHERYSLKITRDRLLETSLKATKGFSVSDWCKNFEINFADEEAVDWGGVRREWFELLCINLFDPKYSELFYRFKNDKQGLVHPNPKRSTNLSLKYYEFAGKVVGKCMYESALGSSYRQLVKARFTRSFLAQLIGLRVHYKYFEQDDPDLYISKIKYIVENDVADMELTFTEEEYDNNGQLIRVVDLIPGGSKIEVTNENKMQYLDALAQHRLVNSVKDEVEHFLKGLNDLIPDNLLAIFDENELELLMCGTGQYSISEFKANHLVSGASEEFHKVLDWFWNAVSNFTDEEMARLLQFTTGCSQLPPGGFVELNPKFLITSTPVFGTLPTAHTCFNQICLPEYDSYEQFERALKLAIYEGSEGFGIA